MKPEVWRDRYGKQFWCVTHQSGHTGLVTYQFLTWDEAMDKAIILAYIERM